MKTNIDNIIREMNERLKQDDITTAMCEITKAMNEAHSDEYSASTFMVPCITEAQTIAVNRFLRMGRVTVASVHPHGMVSLMLARPPRGY